jgi:hypothetical protein
MAQKKKTNVKRSKKQHTPDYYPVQRRIPIGVDGGTLTGTVVGDVGKLLSIANRRLYRYGNLYQIKVDLDMNVTANADVQIDVYALRNTWDVQRGYALAKKIWDESTAEERESASSNIARWRDFRIDAGVVGATFADPVSNDNASLAAGVDNDGEHDVSNVDIGGVSTRFTWGNAGAGLIDVMGEWTKAGITSTDPSSVVTTAPYDGVNADEMSDIEMESLGNDGNNPPYQATSPTDCLVKVGTIFFRAATSPADSGSLQRLSTGYFDAPCGLFALKFNTGQNRPNGDVSITVKSGDYKGVHALSMSQ